MPDKPLTSPTAPVVAKPMEPVLSNPALSAPQERWAADRAAIVASDPWQQDPARVAMVKDPVTGEVTARARDGSATVDPAKAAEPVRSQDGSKFVFGEGLELSEQQIRELVEHKAAQDARKLSAPATPDAFKVELPTDLKLPPGMEFKLDPNSPMIAPAKAYALKHGFTQEQFSELVGLYAASTAGEVAQFNAARAAEVEKLGAAANARVDAVKTWLQAVGGRHFAALAKSLEAAPVAGTIEGFEVLMQKFTSQGGGNYSGANREPNQPGKLTDEQYSKLTYTQQKEYALQFRQ